MNERVGVVYRSLKVPTDTEFRYAKTCPNEECHTCKTLKFEVKRPDSLKEYWEIHTKCVSWSSDMSKIMISGTVSLGLPWVNEDENPPDPEKKRSYFTPTCYNEIEVFYDAVAQTITVRSWVERELVLT